jgi:diguanylate cyclase (GGDEF)-like protein/PAS domain S-box-containing protein
VLALAGMAGHAAAPRTLRFERLGIEQGLPQESVTAMLQDGHGFLWLGTQAGLVRYDGYRVITYRADSADPQALADNWVTALHVDAQGRLWVGSRGGLQRFDAALGRFERIDLGNGSERGPGSRHVRAIVAGPAGSGGRELWIGTAAGLHRLEPASGRVQSWHRDPARTDGLPGEQAIALCWDAAGGLWIGSESGLARLDPRSGRIERFRLDSEQAPEARRNAVSALRLGRDGRLWIGTGAGLEVWTLGAGAPVRRRFGAADGFLAGEVETVLVDREGRVWIGSRTAGLFRWDEQARRFIGYRHADGDAHSLADDHVYSLFQDSSGTLWAGTWSNGASRVDLASGGFEIHAGFERQPGARDGDKIYAIAEDAEGLLWLGSVGGGLHRYDPRTFALRTYRHDPDDPASLPHDTVRSVHRDARGRLWVGTHRGLARLDPASGRFQLQWRMESEPELEQVRRIASTSDGVLWLGTSGGLVRHDPGSGETRVYRHDPEATGSLSYGWVTALHIDRRGRLWIGTQTGLDRLTADGEQFEHVRADPGRADSLGNDRISHIAEDRHGRLWIGTAGGLHRLDDPAAPVLRFRRYARTQGLGADPVGTVLETGTGELWVSTTAGLSRLDPYSGEVRNYTARDGLIDGSYYIGSGYAAADGRLFFGGPNGLTEFRPDAIRENPVPPAVVITDLQVFNRPLDPAALPEGVALQFPIHQAHELRFAHDQSVFTLEFAALHYADPARNRYAYRLLGLGDEWIEVDAGHRYVSYANLAPGDYAFEVRAANKDGVWSAAPARLAIHVLPPWWGTWWFRALAAALLLGGVWALFRYRMHGLRMQQARLEEQVRARTAEVVRQKEDLEQQNARIEQAHNTLTVLGEIGRDITATLDEGALFETLDRHVHDLLDAASFSIYLLDADGRGLTSALRMEEGRALPVFHVEIDHPTRHTARCARERRELHIELDPDDPHSGHVPGTLRSLSMLFAPLAVGERLLGVMTIQSPRPHAYGEREKQVFRTLSAYGAIALDNAKAYRRLADADAEYQLALQEKQRWLEQEIANRTAEVRQQKADIEQAHNTLSVLGEIGREITAVLDQAEVCQTLDRHVHGLLDAATFAIYLLDPDGRQLTSILRVEEGKHLPQARIAIDNPVRHAAICARERREILFDMDPAKDNPSQVPGTLRILSSLFAPLLIGERLLGVMTIQSPRRHAYGERETQVFRTLSAYGAIALDNAAAYLRVREADAEVQRIQRERQAWLEQEVQARTAEVVRQKEDIEQAHRNLSVLGEIGREITATLDEAAAVETLDRHVHDLLDATTFVIYRLDADDRALTSILDVEEGKPLPSETIALDDPARNAARCARERRELEIDVAPDEIDPSHVPGTLHTLSALFAPLLIGERLLGVMTIQSPRRHAYGEREKVIFRTLCAYGAIALDNATAYRRLAEAEADVQRVLREQQLIFDNAAVAVFFVKNRVIRRCNRGMEEMLGYGPGELVGQSTRIYHPSDESWEALGRQIYPAVNAGTVSEGEWQIMRRDGELIWIAYRGRAIDPGDESKGTIWVAQDISERKRTEAELERIRREQQIIFDNSPGGGILLTRDRTIVSCNPGLEALLGYEPGGLTGKPARVNFASDEAYEAFGRWAYPILAAGGTAKGEVEYCDRHGEPIMAYVSGKAIDPDDMSQGVVWLAQDIRQQKKDAAELDRARRELQIIFDNNIGAIAIIRDGRIERCSRGFQTMYGYGTEEVVGMPVEAFAVSPEASQALGLATTPELAAGKVVSGEFEYRRKDGSTGWLVYQGRALQPPELDKGTIWLCQDISKLKGQENALLASKAQVEQSLVEVEQLNRQVTMLGEMTGFLQACPNAEEAYSCIGEFGPRLFVGSVGVLYLADEEGRAWIEHGRWGSAGLLVDRFSAGDCWALRRSRAYRVDAPSSALCCPHVPARDDGRRPYACLPLTAQGKTFGLLHIEYADTADGDAAERRHGVAVAMAEQIALAIANLQLREALLQQSIRDPLTGLYNRRYLQEALFREMAHSRRNQSGFAVLMIDVDHFKQFNDSFGHHAGDLVLQSVARVIEAQFRRSDVACRFGGEEFTVLLPGTGLELAQRLAHGLLDGIRGLVLSHEGRPLDRITASLGLALFPDHGSSPQALLEAADAALYQAKSAGRNRVVVCGS